MRFAHFADCHLGSWRQPELRQINLESFKLAIDISIKEKVDFVLIAGDLFDSAYPPVEILEEAFYQLRRLKDNNISCYFIAGSHDYSASGKTFLSVLEKAGFCTNVYSPEIREDKIFLNPIIHQNVAIYGYPGKKAGLEVQELKNVKLQDSPFFKVFALHTSIKGAVGSLPIESVEESSLPKADYYALGHLHINYCENNFVYAGPIYPNNFQELEELKYGSIYIVDTNPLKYRRIELKVKDVEFIDLEINNAMAANEIILHELEKRDLKNKILLLRIYGKLVQGKISDIAFSQIETYAKDKGCYSILKSISQLEKEEAELKMEVDDMEVLEENIIKKYNEENNSKFNQFIPQLINAMSLEKEEDETSINFNSRLFSELNKTLNIENDNKKS